MGIKNFFKNAFSDMKQNAKDQHEVDTANFQAVKAESRANFEENRGKNTFKKAKQIGKQSWVDALMTPAERSAKTKELQQKQIEEANQRKQVAEERIKNAKQ